MLEKKENYTVAIVGATGAVGTDMLQLLESRSFPIENLKLLASARSAGKTLKFKNQDVTIEELKEDSFEGVDIALFSAGGGRSKEYAPLAVNAGAVVIDNSSAFRMDPEVPLVVPEVNSDALQNHKGIIANPNCTTIIMLVALNPIHQINPIKRIVVSSYQAVSGAGAQALEELKTQQRQILAGDTPKAEIFKHVIADNIFSHDSDVTENGYNLEEMKMVQETKKILNSPEIEVNPTCIRVPIARAHSEAIQIELTRSVNLEEIQNILKSAPGLQVVDNPESNHFPMPLEASGQDDVLVGRVRKDLANDHVLNLFVCGDQLLKGAALNAVQIAEILIKN